MSLQYHDSMIIITTHLHNSQKSLCTSWSGQALSCWVDYVVTHLQSMFAPSKAINESLDDTRWGLFESFQPCNLLMVVGSQAAKSENHRPNKSQPHGWVCQWLTLSISFCDMNWVNGAKRWDGAGSECPQPSLNFVHKAVVASVQNHMLAIVWQIPLMRKAQTPRFKLRSQRSPFRESNSLPVLQNASCIQRGNSTGVPCPCR